MNWSPYAFITMLNFLSCSIFVRDNRNKKPLQWRRLQVWSQISLVGGGGGVKFCNCSGEINDSVMTLKLM
jgi:hypothetical protein